MAAFPLLKIRCQELKKLHHITIIRLIPVIIYDNVPLTDRLRNLQKSHILALGAAPCKFRPETDPHICRDHILNGGGIIALKNNLRREPGMLTEPVADIAELP